MTADRTPTYELTPLMELWQYRQGGRDLREAIIAEIRAHGSPVQASRNLGVSYPTFREWMDRLGIRAVRTLHWELDPPGRVVTNGSSETPLAAAG